MAAPKGKTYRVNATAREGFLDRRRAGEAWPRGAGNFREVFVLDDQEDPPGRKLEDGTFAIGQKTFAILKKDPEIFMDSVDRSDGAGIEAEKWRQRATDAARRVVELEAVAKNDPEKAALREQIDELKEQIAEAVKENETLTQKVSELEHLIAEATKPTPSKPADQPKAPAATTGNGGPAK